MDILTQGLLGGVLAQSVARKEETKWATLVGIFSGLIADADFFIYSSNDPLLNIEFHRHFTHSLFFIPIGAAIATLLLWPFLRKYLSLSRLYLYSFLGYSLSGVLDAFTSYGTHLLWPFSDERIAFNIISIIDPVFTLTLLIALTLSFRMKRAKVAQIGLICALGYMSIGFIQSQRAHSVAEDLMASRGHQATKSLVKPTLANLLLYRSVYVYNDRIYVDAINVGLFSDSQIYEGKSVALFAEHKHLPNLKSTSILYNDIQRFKAFSSDYIALDTTQGNVIGDLRYSMLPNTVKPLWGITVDLTQPDEHAHYLFFRDGGENIRQKFLKMLFGS